MNYLDLFHGIGGFALGAHLAEIKFDNHYCSDNNDYCQKLYNLRFPESIQLGDVKKINFEGLKGGWIISAGFPCQPHSIAGKRAGAKDERNLWPLCRRAISILRPKFAILENVPGLLTSESGSFFAGILGDFATIGYNVEWKNVSAEDFGALHKRERIFLVAYPTTNDTWCKRTQGSWQKKISKIKIFSWCKDIRNVEDLRSRQNIPEPLVCRETLRLSDGVDRLRAIGNSIVPQIAELIFRQIKEVI